MKSLLSLFVILSTGQAMAADTAEAPIRCKANEVKWYVAYQQEGGVTGRIIVCGTAGLATTEEGLNLVSVEIKKSSNLKKLPVILNVIKLDK